MSGTAPVHPAGKPKTALWLSLAAGATLAGVLAYWVWVSAAPAAATAPQWVDRVQAGVAQASQAGRVTMVELGSTACVGCREMKPVLHALQTQHGNRVQVVDIDILKETEYIKVYQVKLMPTQLFYDAQGKLLGRHLGKIDVAGLSQHLGLDSGLPDGR